MCGCVLTEGRNDRLSAVVDHIIPTELRPGLEAEPDNLWSVCKQDQDVGSAGAADKGDSVQI